MSDLHQIQIKYPSNTSYLHVALPIQDPRHQGYSTASSTRSKQGFACDTFHQKEAQNPEKIHLHPSVYLSICLSVYLSVCLSIYLSVCQCIYLSVCLSIYLSVCLSVYLSVCLSIYLSVCLSVFLSVYLSIQLTIYLPIYLIYVGVHIHIYA